MFSQQLKGMVSRFVGSIPSVMITTGDQMDPEAPPTGRPVLRFHAPGANCAEHARGVAAAYASLSSRGFTAEQAKRGADARETWGDSGLLPDLEPSVDDSKAADAWDEAVGAALTTCYRSRRIPLEAGLYLSGSSSV